MYLRRGNAQLSYRMLHLQIEHIVLKIIHLQIGGVKSALVKHFVTRTVTNFISIFQIEICTSDVVASDVSTGKTCQLCFMCV